MRSFGRFSRVLFALAVLCLVFVIPTEAAQQKFEDLVGPVTVGKVTSTSTVEVPYILWGGDYATFYANGGLTTKPGSIYAKLGLSIRLVPGDDTIEQTRHYVSGQSPFFRGTYAMAAWASEVLNQTPDTQGIAELHMTYSQGDHLVCRANVRTIADLRGTTIAIQQGGPHPDLVDEILRDAKLSWKDVTIIWAKDLTGTPESPAEMFKKNQSIDCATVVTPDMIGLTGGLQNVGSGAEGTSKGAHVLVSTADRIKTIADLYFVRSDFAREHADWVTKFSAGYLKAVEEIIELKKKYQTSGSPEMDKLLKLAVSIYGTKLIPNEVEAFNLLSDCTFVGHPGNVSFFTDTNNTHGFSYFNDTRIGLAVNLGYASARSPFKASTLDWNSSAFMGYLSKTTAVKTERFEAKKVQAEIEKFTEGQLDDRTIYDFTISFEPNQKEFSVEAYGKSFQEAISLADKYGGAALVIRGHADPAQTLSDFVSAGMKKGTLKRTGQPGNYSYYLNGQPLDLASTEKLVKLITDGSFDGVDGSNPRETMQAAQNLSLARAQEVREALMKYAKQKGVTIDSTQLQPQGVGIKEPIIAKPKNLEDAKKNMRVEFRLIRVSAEASKPSDFNY